MRLPRIDYVGTADLPGEGTVNGNPTDPTEVRKLR
jgi:hypothetical protein